MTREEFVSMLHELAQGWRARDYRAVAGHFTEELFYSDAINYTLRDRGSLLRFFQDDDGHSQMCVFRDAVFDESRQVGCAEYSYKGSFLYHGSVWVKIEADKIVEWREYQHKTKKEWGEFWKR